MFFCTTEKKAVAVLMIVFKYKVKKKLENVQGDKIKNNGD